MSVCNIPQILKYMNIFILPVEGVLETCVNVEKGVRIPETWVQGGYNIFREFR